MDDSVIMSFLLAHDLSSPLANAVSAAHSFRCMMQIPSVTPRPMIHCKAADTAGQCWEGLVGQSHPELSLALSCSRLNRGLPSHRHSERLFV